MGAPGDERAVNFFVDGDDGIAGARVLYAGWIYRIRPGCARFVSDSELVRARALVINGNARGAVESRSVEAIAARFGLEAGVLYALADAETAVARWVAVDNRVLKGYVAARRRRRSWRQITAEVRILVETVRTITSAVTVVLGIACAYCFYRRHTNKIANS